MDAQQADPGLPGLSQEPAAVTDNLTRARRGDLAAFRELMRRHQGRVFSVALRFTGQRADAEELLQDVFLQLHGALAQIESDDHLKHWLLRTVSHRCIDRLRRAGRRPRLVSIAALSPGSEPRAAECASDPIAGTRLRQLLLDLAPDARAVMVLRYQEDLDPLEIADMLEMPLPTVKSHLRRSLDWMRAQMETSNHGS